VAIGPDEIRRIAELASLDLDRSAEAFDLQLCAILDHVAMLDELDVTDDAPPIAFGTTGQQRLRDDDVCPGPGAEAALENAPDAAAGHFRVPKVVES